MQREKKLNERAIINLKTVKQLQSPKSLALNKHNIIAAKLVTIEPKDIKMTYPVSVTIMNHPYLYSIYKEMEWLAEIERINIIHVNLVDLCRMISTAELKKTDISAISSTNYKVYTDLNYTIFIKKVNSHHSAWLFEKERLIAVSIKTEVIKLDVNIAMINKRIRIIQAFELLLSMGPIWVDFYPLQVRNNDCDKVIRWAHHKEWEEVLAYWISRGDKIIVDRSGDIPVFIRKSLVRSIKQADGTYKNTREERNDRIDTYDLSQLLLNK